MTFIDNDLYSQSQTMYIVNDIYSQNEFCDPSKQSKAMLVGVTGPLPGFDFSPDTVLMDFEMAMRNSVHIIWPSIFHN